MKYTQQASRENLLYLEDAATEVSVAHRFDRLRGML